MVNALKGSTWRLRSYTREFAKKMAEIHPDMIRGNKRISELSESDAAKELQRFWKGTDFGDTWEDARLADVARYLIGAKGLEVPQQFAWMIPSHL